MGLIWSSMKFLFDLVLCKLEHFIWEYELKYISNILYTMVLCILYIRLASYVCIIKLKYTDIFLKNVCVKCYDM